MLETEIKVLQHQLLEMTGITERMLQQALQSVLTRDEVLAEAVIATDDTVDIFENQIESTCIQLIALHQPVAFELRFLTSAMKICRNIERIGDKSVSIAKRSLELLQYPPFKPFADLPYVSQLIMQLVKDAVDAFVNRNAELARRIRQRDCKIDAIYERVLEEILEILSGHPKLISSGISILLLFRHLERIGDLAANIGEDVYYLVKGDVIRHQNSP